MRSKVEIIVGDVRNAKQVLNAVEGVDGVVVVLGTRNDFRPTTVMSNGMINIIAAMKTHNVEIVTVCLSSSLFYEPENVPKLYINTNADHQRTYNALKNSQLKYVAVFPPQIIGKLLDTKYKNNLFLSSLLYFTVIQYLYFM